jgi:hypothetical protein
MATVNKQAVAAAFGRAAGGYSQHDELQRRSAVAAAPAGASRFSPGAGCWLRPRRHEPPLA